MIKTSTFSSNYYEMEMTEARAGRQIYCVVTDQYGNSVTTATATLTMTSKIVIVKDLESVEVKPGQMATVTVEAEGENLSYRWYYMDANIGRFIPTGSFTGNTYTVAMNSARDGRQLYCVVTDAYGNTINTSTVTISMAK